MRRLESYAFCFLATEATGMGVIEFIRNFTEGLRNRSNDATHLVCPRRASLSDELNGSYFCYTQLL